MAGTFPYDESLSDLLTRSIEHEVIVYMVRVDVSPAAYTRLDLISGTLTKDERRLPMVEAVLDVAMVSQATLDLLDPRTGAVRLEVYAGYYLPSGKQDTWRLASLALRRRTVSRPGDRITLVGQSDEALLMDAAPMPRTTLTHASKARGIIQTLIDGASIPGLSIVEGFATVADMGGLTSITTTDRLDAIVTLADSIGAQFGTVAINRGEMYLNSPAFLTEPILDLRTGPLGTLTRTSVELNRQNNPPWANHVILDYRWTPDGGVEQVVTGQARVTSGPFSVNGTARSKRYVEQREGPVTQAVADASAVNLLNRRLNYGRITSLEAVAAYWVTPRQTITVQLPTGPRETHLVHSVAFDLVAGTMTVGSRLPETSPTIATGA